MTVDTIDGLREAAGTATQLTISVDAVPEAALDNIASIDGVREVNATDRIVTVHTENGSKTAILHALESAGAEILDFSTSETSLEELFASYTGVDSEDRIESETSDVAVDDADTDEEPTAPDTDAEYAEVAR